MPKRRRHEPGKYKPKPETEIKPNFTGPKPLTVFQAENGLWGAKDGEGNIEIEPRYQLAPQTDEEKASNSHRLCAIDEVLLVTPDDWDLLCWCGLD